MYCFDAAEESAEAVNPHDWTTWLVEGCMRFWSRVHWEDQPGAACERVEEDESLDSIILIMAPDGEIVYKHPEHGNALIAGSR